jgi:hypothetical protein
MLLPVMKFYDYFHVHYQRFHSNHRMKMHQCLYRTKQKFSIELITDENIM